MWRICPHFSVSPERALARLTRFGSRSTLSNSQCWFTANGRFAVLTGNGTRRDRVLQHHHVWVDPGAGTDRRRAAGANQQSATVTASSRLKNGGATIDCVRDQRRLANITQYSASRKVACVDRKSEPSGIGACAASARQFVPLPSIRCSPLQAHLALDKT